MGELCESAIANATKALSDGSIEQAKAVINADAEIDEMEKDIEKLCLKLLLQQQPVAKDLRRISAALKMITDMERIGDQTADIAEIVISANTEESVDIKDLGRMASVVSKMVRDSVTSYVQKDLELARQVMLEDDKVDRLFDNIREEMVNYIAINKGQRGSRIVDLIMVTKYLERIGDHASDIAELILRIKSEHAYHIVKHLPLMAEEARKMVHDAVEAFISQDLEETEKIIRMDDRVDSLFNQVKTDVISLLKTSPDQADQGIDLLMVAKYLERIGDHAVNVCEWTEFSKTGALKHVRIM